jgi:hypothetical protein
MWGTRKVGRQRYPATFKPLTTSFLDSFPLADHPSGIVVSAAGQKPPRSPFPDRDSLIRMFATPT